MSGMRGDAVKANQKLAKSSLMSLMTMSTFAVLVLVMGACSADKQVQNSGIGTSHNATGIVNGTDDTGTETWAGTVIGLGTKTYVGNGYTIFCSGTLVGKNTIVTAGHCVEAMYGDAYVVFGLGENAANVEGRKIIKSATHEKYGSVVIDESAKDVFDIGMAEFEGDLPAGFKPAQILPDDTVLKNGATILLVGYGVTSGAIQTGSGVLRHTSVPIRDEAYGISEIQTDEVAAGSCNGDSGGPGFIEQNGQIYLWGTTSRGDSGCVNNGIYTKVTYYRDWLNQKLNTWANEPAPAPVTVPAPVTALGAAAGF
jgi:secreted trypsin-like serine protease